MCHSCESGVLKLDSIACSTCEVGVLETGSHLHCGEKGAQRASERERERERERGVCVRAAQPRWRALSSLGPGLRLCECFLSLAIRIYVQNIISQMGFPRSLFLGRRNNGASVEQEDGWLCKLPRTRARRISPPPPPPLCRSATVSLTTLKVLNSSSCPETSA